MNKLKKKKIIRFKANFNFFKKLFFFSQDQRNFSNEQKKKRNEYGFFQEKNFNPDFKSEKISRMEQEEEEEKKENEAIFEVIPQSNQLRCRYCFELIQYTEIETAEKYHNKNKCVQKLKEKNLIDELNSSSNF